MDSFGTEGQYDELSESVNSYAQDSNPGGYSFTPSDYSRPAIDWSNVFTGSPDRTGDWMKLGASALDKALNFTLARDQLQAQTALIRAGRSVGYGFSPYGMAPQYGAGGGNLFQLLLVGGLIFLGVKAVSKAA